MARTNHKLPAYAHDAMHGRSKRSEINCMILPHVVVANRPSMRIQRSEGLESRLCMHCPRPYKSCLGLGCGSRHRYYCGFTKSCKKCFTHAQAKVFHACPGACATVSRRMVKHSCQPGRRAPYGDDLRWRMVWQREVLGLKLGEVAKCLNVL